MPQSWSLSGYGWWAWASVRPLRSVTLSLAEAAGVADRYGSLEAGKVANVVVWTGDPLEFSSRVEYLFIRGREIPLVSRQTELLERYRTVPPRY
jgi:imidazolonepropionase-like amidohydrolase